MQNIKITTFSLPISRNISLKLILYDFILLKIFTKECFQLIKRNYTSLIVVKISMTGIGDNKSCYLLSLLYPSFKFHKLFQSLIYVKKLNLKCKTTKNNIISSYKEDYFFDRKKREDRVLDDLDRLFQN